MAQIPRRRQIIIENDPAPRRRQIIIEDEPVPRRRRIIIDNTPEVEQIRRVITRGTTETQLPNIQQIRILRDADVYDTPALTRAKQQIAELASVQNPTPEIKREIKRLRGIIADRKYKQRLATEKRRDEIPTTQVNNFSYRPNQIIDFTDIDNVKQQFNQFEGQDIIISIKLKNGERIARRLRYFKRNFFNDIFDGFLGSKAESAFEIRDDLENQPNNIRITRESVLPANTTWTQIFRENQTHTCVQDSLISLLDATKKNDKTLINKLTKLKSQFPDGMTEEQIQEHIVDAMSLPIDIKLPLPIKSLESTLRPKTDKTFRKLTLVNTVPGHVEPLKTEWTELKYNNYDTFKNDVLPRLSNALYSVVPPKEDDTPETQFSQYILPDGIMTYIPDKPLYIKDFTDQYKSHTSTVNVDGVNSESPIVEYQAIEFMATPVYIKNSDEPVQELDMKKAYTSYTEDFPGYLIAFEDGVFSQDQFQEIVAIHQNEWTTLYWDIQITQASKLHVLLNLPERIVCPTWFIQSVLQEEGVEFIIFRYEVRKSFTMNFDDLPKKEYVKLFGKTAQHPRRTNYFLQGEFSPEFYKWVQSKLIESKNTNTRCNIRVSQFEGENPNYVISHEGLTRNVCPQILNCVSLWCFSKIYKVAKSVPIDTILGKTLDSIFLSTPIPVPDLFKEKGTIDIDGQLRHPYFNKSINACIITGYSHVEFLAKNYLPSFKTFTLKTPFLHINEDIGAGGNGKTYARMNLSPNGILALPTHELINDKRKEYPNRTIITHHHLAGWMCKQFENVRVAYIDELTQLTQEQKEDISNKHPNATLFFMGDIDPISGLPFQMYSTLSKYDIENPHYHTVDYRSQDQETKDYKERLRKRLQVEFSKKMYNKYSNMDAIIKECVSQYHELDPSLPILTATRWCCDYYNSINIKSLNSHRVQGKTLSDVFQIDVTTMSHQAFYTCISRATNISNIRFIKASNKMDQRWEFRATALKNLIEEEN
jgi:hypothetical protein